MTTRKWGSETLVNTLTAGEQHNSSVAALSTGGFVVVWQDDSGPSSAIRSQRFDAYGQVEGTETTVIAVTGNNATFPDVTALDNGMYQVNWTFNVVNTNYILGNVYDANGGLVRSPPAVFAPVGDFVTGASNAPFQNGWIVSGGAIVAWTDPATNSGDILYRYFDNAGNGSATFTANTNTAGSQSNVDVAASPIASHTVMVWEDNGATVKGRVFIDGTPFGNEFTIGALANGPVGSPKVTYIEHGVFAVTWESPGGEAVCRVYRESSDPGIPPFPITGEMLVSSSFAHADFAPSIVGLPSGGFAVAWAGYRSGDVDQVIYLQTFDEFGGRMGGQIIVSTTVSDFQVQPSVAVLADGRVAVSWTDHSAGNDDIRVQIIDPRDGIIDGTNHADMLLGHEIVSDLISGFDGADQLFGLGGADGLYGGAGADILTGGRGDDTAYGGAGSDTLNGNQGDDQLFGGKDADSLTGGKGDDEYNGGAGNDIIFDAEGDDTINGGADTDKVDYAFATAGITTSLDGTLTAKGAAAGDTYISIEQLAGTDFADILRGNAAANTIFGRSGDDRITGAGGKDVLVGNAGNDTFAYGTVSDSAPTARDQINDFTVVAGDGTGFADHIDLSAIDAIPGGGNDAFAFIGTAAFSAAGQVRVTATGASDTLVEINTSGTSGAEMAILLKGILPTAIFDEDFVL